jgi:hypothetical protein
MTARVRAASRETKSQIGLSAYRPSQRERTNGVPTITPAARPGIFVEDPQRNTSNFLHQVGLAGHGVPYLSPISGKATKDRRKRHGGPLDSAS